MRAGAFGPATQWAIDHQIKVGTYLGAADFVPVTQAHIMADTESLGLVGVEWLERWGALTAAERRAGGPPMPRPPRPPLSAAAPVVHHAPVLRARGGAP